MKRLATAVGIAAFLAVAVVGEAQQPATPGGHHPPGQAGPGGPPPGGPGGGGHPGPGGGPMMHGTMPSMDMCRQMMARHHAGERHERHDPMAMMMGPMMRMMGPGADPKVAGQMLEMRGEMMKAVGEIMMKHGQRMHGGPAR